MNLRQIVDTKVADIYAGGPGSGCNPDVGKCGRPKGFVESATDGVFKGQFMKLMQEWYEDYEHQWDTADEREPKSEWLKLGKDMSDYAERLAMSPNTNQRMFIVYKDGQAKLAGIFKIQSTAKSLDVPVLVANPKYIGRDKDALKEMITFLRKQAKDNNLKTIEFERAGKGKDDSVSGWRSFKASMRKGKYA